MNKPIVLECKLVKFYAPHDEDAFFEWVQKIKCIKECKGKGNKIFLTISSNKIKKEELRDLFALFRRYKINLKQLDIFSNTKNEEDFHYYKKCFSVNIYPASPG